MRLPQLLVLSTALLTVPVLAKLPAPSDEAKAKAAEAAAKSAWNDKVSAFKLCKAMDRVAEHYRKQAKTPATPVETPACADPGPYVPAAPSAAASGAAAPAVAAASAPAVATAAPAAK
jgi:hypothetical protein